MGERNVASLIFRRGTTARVRQSVEETIAIGNRYYYSFINNKRRGGKRKVAGTVEERRRKLVEHAMHLKRIQQTIIQHHLAVSTVSLDEHLAKWGQQLETLKREALQRRPKGRSPSAGKVRGMRTAMARNSMLSNQ